MLFCDLSGAIADPASSNDTAATGRNSFIIAALLKSGIGSSLRRVVTVAALNGEACINAARVWTAAYLEPAPPAVVATATENDECDEDDQKGGRIHDGLLWTNGPSRAPFIHS